MKNLIIAVAILAFFAGMATARGPQEVTSVVPYNGAQSRADVVWFDDLESGAVGWTHGDDSAQPYYWHIDSYMAFAGNSWWCGSAAITADGGYGNLWKQYLTSSYIDWTGYSYPVVSFEYRIDAEYNYDFGYVQAESAGVFTNLNRGFTGTIGWGATGFYLGLMDNPAKIRFFFESDGSYSDADGNYSSVGGAFAVDDVLVFDVNTSTVFFTDDADANVNLVPGVPAAGGDFWALDSNNCQAYSDPHVWTCTDPDTTAVPPGLVNWLQTPIVDVTSYAPGTPCTLYSVFQFFMPAVMGGGWQEYSTSDGGATWTMVGNWYGDQCGYGYGPCSHFLFGIPVVWAGNEGTGQVGVRWVMQTDAAGNFSDPACAYYSAGITIDNVQFEMYPGVAVENSSWGKIKSLYR